MKYGKLTQRQMKIVARQVIAGAEFSEDIAPEIWKQIVAIKDYETIHWDVDRLMTDIITQDMTGTGS